MQRLSKGIGDKRLLRLINAYLKAGLRVMTSIVKFIEELNSAFVGWTNYFNLANKWLSDFAQLDGWIRRKLRCYRLKQRGRRYSIHKFLIGLGIAEQTSWNIVMYSQGWWEMSKKTGVNQAVNLLWFAQKGLLSLKLRMTV